jgi:hypothetical protein
MKTFTHITAYPLPLGYTIVFTADRIKDVERTGPEYNSVTGSRSIIWNRADKGWKRVEGKIVSTTIPASDKTYRLNVGDSYTQEVSPYDLDRGYVRDTPLL